MSANGSATATAEPEVPRVISETLSPLLATRDVLLTERREIAEELADKDHEIKAVERVLRAGSLLSSASKPAAKPKPQKGSGVSEEMIGRARDAIEKMHGEFTVKDLREEMGVAELTAGKALKVLHATGEVILAGVKAPAGAKTNSTARHYAAAGR